MTIDREPDGRVDDGGVPGVFLPKLVIMRGVLSAAAYQSFLDESGHLGVEERRALLRNAFARRMAIHGANASLMDVQPADFVASAT